MDRLPLLPAAAAARLFLGAQGLLEDPFRKATPRASGKVLQDLGFVQVDTINVVARAQDLILFSRLHGYRPGHLQRLLERDRALFEGFTHDASLIPLAHYPQWKSRFRRDEARMRDSPWWQHHFRGTDPDSLIRHVLARIRDEGPLMSRDFEHPEKRGPWWGWKPQKAALDFLWRAGRLAIRGRVNFHKVYDLPERVHPEAHGAPEPSEPENVAWACGEAATRLGVFTPRELAGFWEAIGPEQARAWCEAEGRAGRLVRVAVASRDGSPPQPAYALADWEARLGGLPDPPEGIRLLAPFDPVLRDRGRALRRFGFDYRFEAFVPEPQRKHGYYVLPFLEGDRFAGRADAKFHRAEGLLQLKRVGWEAGIRPTRARLRALEEGAARLADFLGAATFQVGS